MTGEARLAAGLPRIPERDTCSTPGCVSEAGCGGAVLRFCVGCCSCRLCAALKAAR